MKLSKQKVTLNIGGTDIPIIRTIHDIGEPQYILSWLGRAYYKWYGHIKLFGFSMVVWGYSGNNQEFPEKWGNTGNWGNTGT